jgi:hypothetical protein
MGPFFIQILRPRGLLESKVSALLGRLSARCTEYLGSLVIFELIDMCREFLTENNAPSSKCAICLLDIADDDVFVKTVCYHYFHSCCLGQYVQNATAAHDEYLRENPAIPGMNEDRNLSITCAVCREKIEDVRMHEWIGAPRPVLEKCLDEFTMTPELEMMQRRMRALYLKQKKNGSLINVEADSKKFLVSTATTSAATTAADVFSKIDGTGGMAPAIPVAAESVKEYVPKPEYQSVENKSHDDGSKGKRGGGGGGRRDRNIHRHKAKVDRPPPPAEGTDGPSPDEECVSGESRHHQRHYRRGGGGGRGGGGHHHRAGGGGGRNRDKDHGGRGRDAAAGKEQS